MKFDVLAQARARLLDNRSSLQLSLLHFDQVVMPKLSVQNRERVGRALKFALSIDYQHPGLTANSYIKHPLRVACSVSAHTPVQDPDIIITALIHNVLEVSRICAEDIRLQFGAKVSTAVQNLTIDRTCNDSSCKLLYYETLVKSWRGTRQVKVLDKYDNIFMICFNPSLEARTQYLDEIEQWIIPMAQHDVPELSNDFVRAVRFMRKVGFISKEALEDNLFKTK